MSKLACQCGHTISDTTDRLPYKADFLPAMHDEDLFVAIANAAQSFVAAVIQGDRKSWLKRQGFLDGYPSDLSHADVFGDFVTSQTAAPMKASYGPRTPTPNSAIRQLSLGRLFSSGRIARS
jgi:hypothetical protein